MKNLILLLTVLLNPLCSAHAVAQVGALEVYVRDLQGKPVSEATVYAMASEHTGGRVPRFQTDAKGLVLLKDLRPGKYEVHAFKDSEGYANNVFAFFSLPNTKAWRFAEVAPNRTAKLTLELGPKCARLKIVVRDGRKSGVGGSLLLLRIDDPKKTLQTAISGDTVILVPPTSFRFQFEADGYQPWRSEVLSPRPDETFEVTVNLRKK